MPTVLVTGAGRGIGRATALRLAASGWDVYAGVRHEDDGAALVADASGRMHPLHLDIMSANSASARAHPRAPRPHLSWSTSRSSIFRLLGRS